MRPAVLFLLSIALAAPPLAGCAVQPRGAQIAQRPVMIETDPPGADVIVNGKFVGTTPVPVSFAPGGKALISPLVFVPILQLVELVPLAKKQAEFLQQSVVIEKPGYAPVKLTIAKLEQQMRQGAWQVGTPLEVQLGREEEEGLELTLAH